MEMVDKSAIQYEAGLFTLRAPTEPWVMCVNFTIMKSVYVGTPLVSSG